MDFAAATIPHAVINDIRQVRVLEALNGKLTTTRTPDGKLIHMQPMAVDIESAQKELGVPRQIRTTHRTDPGRGRLECLLK